MKLRVRLLLALLALAILPTAVFTAFTLALLEQGVTRWYSPPVNRSLVSAREVTLTSLSRLEAAVLAQAGTWAGSWSAAGMTRQRRAEMSASLGAAGLDFIQLYRREGEGWRRIDEIVPEGVMLVDRRDLAGQIPVRLESPTVLRSRTGALAAAAPLPDGSALVAGLWVPPDFFDHVDRLAEAMTYYSRLDVVARLWRGYLGLVVAGIVLAVGLMALLLAHLLARGLSRPLAELSHAIEQVAAGDLRTRVEPRGASEVRSLALSFNSMTERLEVAREAVQRAEREAAWREVARKLAHEFKNLLTPMQLSLQLLECQIQSVPEKERKTMTENLEAVVREMGHLERLANQFSQYARLPEPRFEAVDLDELVRSVARLLPDAAVEVVTSGPPSRARGDRLLLSRAVHNLLLNAWEAAPTRPIELRVATAGDQAVVEVLDRGPGLPEPLRERLFDPYVSTKQRGSGLGLSLVRDVARQHGGTVTIENREGGGARAVLAIPAAGEPERRTA